MYRLSLSVIGIGVKEEQHAKIFLPALLYSLMVIPDEVITISILSSFLHKDERMLAHRISGMRSNVFTLTFPPKYRVWNSQLG